MLMSVFGYCCVELESSFKTTHHQLSELIHISQAQSSLQRRLWPLLSTSQHVASRNFAGMTPAELGES